MKLAPERLEIIKNAIDKGVTSISEIARLSGATRKTVAAIMAEHKPQPVYAHLERIDALAAIHVKREGESIGDWLERTERERITLDPTPMKKFVPSGNGDPDSQQEWESFTEYCERRDRERRG